jgi:glycosyltransferase involved in cell wall biosynthesis
VAKKTLIALNNFRSNVQVFALKSALSNRKLPLPWVCDPITLFDSKEKTAEFRQLLNKKPPKYWVGVFGYITPRKNLDLVLDSIEGDDNFGLVIAGSIDQEVWASLEGRLDRLNADGRFVFHSGPLDDVSLDSAIASVDVVLAAHSNDGPSGIVAKAAALKKPLALAGARSLRLDSKNLVVRARWTELDSIEIYKSLKSLVVSDGSGSEYVPMDDDFLTKLLP